EVIIQCLPIIGPLYYHSGVIPGQNDNITDNVKLRPSTGVDVQQLQKRLQEVMNFLELLRIGIGHDGDVLLPPELLQEVLVQLLSEVEFSHPAPPRSYPNWSPPVPAGRQARSCRGIQEASLLRTMWSGR